MTHCYCGSEKNYSDCCKLFLTQKKYPETAEQLMRSRFSAYALRQHAYILVTCAEKAAEAVDFFSLEESQVEWTHLDLYKRKKGKKSDKEGYVWFKAYYKGLSGDIQCLHEKSYFKKINDQWFYVDGELL